MKRKAEWRWVALAIWLVLALLTPAAALELVYPVDKAWITNGGVLIVKGGAAPALEGVTITINGVTSDLIDISGAEYRAAFADMIILEPEWEAGKNQLEVKGYAGGKAVATVRAEFFYLAGAATALPPKGFARFVMHLPEKEKSCLPCHVMNPDKVQLAASSAESNPCASCHRRKLERKYVHGPAGVYECVACHDPASKPERYRLSNRNSELCNECHADKLEEFKHNAYVHGPVGVGLCVTCHDPHASDHPAQLHAAVNDVCLGCHSTIREGEHVVRGVGGKGHPLKGKKNPLDAARGMSCASCHNPHGGQGRNFFIRGITGRFQLCQECHKK